MKRIAIALAGAAMLCTMPAMAQQVSGQMGGTTGTRLGQIRQQDSPEFGVRFARCLTGYKHAEAEEFVRSAPGTGESRQAYEALIPFRDNRCVQMMGIEAGGASLQMPERLLRGYLSQALYLERYADGPASVSGSGEDIPVESYNQRMTTTADAQAEVIRIFGDCMALRHGAAIDVLLRTNVESDAESSAIGALVPEMGPCLWNGQSIEFSRESLRAALADGLYRMVTYGGAAG